MKTCGGPCGRKLPEAMFAWKNQAKGWLNFQCRDCQKVYRRQHYVNNITKYKTKASKWAKAAREHNHIMILDYLKEHPCVDCGETDIVVLQFDHVRGKKQFTIGSVMHMLKWDSLLKEIAKCEVRCGNCHIRVTQQRGGHYRYLATCE